MISEMSAIVNVEAPSADTKESSDHVRASDSMTIKQYEDFIGRTFKKMECKIFVPMEESSKLCCCCYDWEDNSNEDSGGSRRGRWNIKADTSKSLTEAFGDLKFSNYDQKDRMYIRVDHETNEKVLLTLMQDHGQMKLPNLLISVIGEDMAFKKKSLQKKAFCDMLIKAVESSHVWIVTGGMNAGLMKLVGNAIHENTTKLGRRSQLVALDIAIWGCIENRKDSNSTHPKKGDQTYVVYKYNKNQKKDGQSLLDPNHTHLILVDNETQNVSGVEIELRAKLENKVPTMKINEDSTSIPVVCVVFGGGPNTLETVKKSIETETPVIILEGSEGAADILAYAYNNIKELKASDDDSPWKKVKEKIKSKFDMTDEELIEKSVYCVRACIRKIDYTMVIHLDDRRPDDDICIALLEAFLKVNQKNQMDHLRLALAWNKLDFAKEKIFTDKFCFEGSVLHDLMFFAIVNNRVEFVKLFLEKGVSLKEFLTLPRFLKLYNDPLARDKCIQLKKKTKDAEVISEEHIEKLITKLSEGLFEAHHYTEGKNVSKRRQNLQNPTNKDEETSSTGSKNTNSAKKALFDEPANELFLWSILHQMKDMAMVFWSEGKEKTALALVGHLLLKGLLKREKDPCRLKDLQGQVKFFEELVDGLLTEYQTSNQQKTMFLLRRTVPGFGKATALEIAVQSDNESFFAHSACESLINDLWMGKLIYDNSNCKLFISIFCPPVAPSFLEFRKDDDKSSEKSSSNKKTETDNTGKSDSQNHSTNSNQNSPPYSFADYFRQLRFFFEAPFIKFWYNCLAYFAFLLLFALILVTDFRPTIRIKEKILIAWVVTIFFEEIRQVVMNNVTNVRWKLHKYITDPWNILDVIAIGIFIVGMIMRFIQNSKCFFASRIILAINFMTFCFRILHMFSIHIQLGPKLVMIGKMVIDLFYFMIILLVFVVAYGIASHVILYPNQPLDIIVARDALSRSWWSIFGELGLEEISAKKCELNKTMKTAYNCALLDYDTYNEDSCPKRSDRCPAINWVVNILLAFYVLVTNILMVNLLIAMFSDTYRKIQSQTNRFWKMQRYDLIREYDSRPLLPPPFIFISHVRLFLRYIYSKKNCCSKEKDKPKEDKELLDWENVIAKEFHRKREAKECDDKADKRKMQRTSKALDLILQNMGLDLPDFDKQIQEDF